MNRLHLVSPENQVLGEITLDAENRPQLVVHDPSLEAPLRELLEQAEQCGVTQRVSRNIEKEGSSLIVEDLVTLMPGDDDFLKALADHISSRVFGGQRVFALVKPCQGEEGRP